MKKSFLRVVVLALSIAFASLSLGGCGKDSSSGNSGGSAGGTSGGSSNGGSSGDGTHIEQYTYDFTVNGCATGSHTFSSKEAECAGLKDGALNNYCAETARHNYFTSLGCTGSFY